MSHILKRLLISLFVILVILTARGNESDHNVGTKMERKMNKQSNPMDKFDFLIGTWHMEYKSTKGLGTGTFKRTLDGKYVFFDYSASGPIGETGAAHGIFAWDQKFKIYRDWWFENSGSFMQATCNFINEETLLMYWQDTLLIQTFQKTGPDKVELKMKQPNAKGEYDPILEVMFTKK
jgi:hypothetical protein